MDDSKGKLEREVNIPDGGSSKGKGQRAKVKGGEENKSKVKGQKSKVETLLNKVNL